MLHAVPVEHQETSSFVMRQLLNALPLLTESAFRVLMLYGKLHSKTFRMRALMTARLPSSIA